jgi:hypothetical protein
MNTTPCNNCIGNFVLFPKDVRLDTKPIKTSASLYTNNKSSYIVSNIKGYGRKSTSKAVWGPGDWIDPTEKARTPSILTGGGVDMKHGGYFRYIMRKRGMTIAKCGCPPP